MLQRSPCLSGSRCLAKRFGTHIGARQKNITKLHTTIGDGDALILNPTATPETAARKAEVQAWISAWRARSLAVTLGDSSALLVAADAMSPLVTSSSSSASSSAVLVAADAVSPLIASSSSSSSSPQVIALMTTDAVELGSTEVVCNAEGLCDEEPKALNDRRRPAAAATAAPTPAPAAAPAAATAADPLADAKEYVQMWAGMGSLLAMDYALKEALKAAGVTFPAPLIGMFAVVAVLMVVGENAAQSISSFYVPALQWVAKWLPLFYVASLVTLPLGLKGIAGPELAKVFGILSVGMTATLLFTGFTAVFIRAVVKTENKEVVKAKPSSPFLPSHSFAWGLIAVVSLALTAAFPTQMGVQAALPFCLACTVGGYLLGNAVPKAFHAILHPVVVTAVLANAGAALYGSLVGATYDQAQRIYYSKGAGPMGAGDLLMSFLGSVIISMGFRIYAQRDTMRRHAPEIVGATLLSSLFSIFSSAYAARALGLASPLARAMIPRSVTVALALPIGAQLEAPLAIVAAAVLLQGLLGANFGPSIMTAVGIKDTIARGLSAAATAGGLGTASLTSQEPEALPFCALSYSMVGILSTCLVTVPQVRAALIGIVG